MMTYTTKSNPKRIMVDVDDTICDMMEPVLRYLKQEDGIAIDRAQLTHFADIGNHVDYDRFLQATEANLPFLPQHPEMVRTVNAECFHGSHIIIATSRGYADNAWRLTLDWLLQNNVSFHDLHIVNECKSEYFANDPFDMVVEDKAECIDAMFEKNLIRDKAFLVDAPWNRYYDHPDVIRINPYTARPLEISNVF